MSDVEHIIAQLRTMPDHSVFTQEGFAHVHKLAFGVSSLLYPIGLTLEELGYHPSELADVIEHRLASKVTNILTT